MKDFFKKYSEVRGEDYVRSLQLEGEIAAQIKTIRQGLNITQQQLADLAKLPKSTIGRIEAGISSPRVETLLKLSKALETPFIIDGTVDHEESSVLL